MASHYNVMISMPSTRVPYKTPTPECLHSKKDVQPYVIVPCKHCGGSYGPTMMDVVRVWLRPRP